MSNVWHVDDASLRSWVDGAAGSLASVSVEQHVLRCRRCQSEVSTLVPATDLAPWEDVLAAVEVPRPSWAERLLRRLGLNASDSLVVSSAPSLRGPWLAATIGALSFAVVAALLADTGGTALFLMLAPLIPVAGVAAAYGPASDPSYEAVLTAPYSMIRLILLRTVSVLTTSVPLVVGAGLFLPDPPLIAVAWLLPAVGFIAVVLTASNWVDPYYAASAVALAWATAVVLAVRTGDPLVLFSPAAVTAYVVILGVAALVLLNRLLGTAPSWRLR